MTELIWNKPASHGRQPLLLAGEEGGKSSPAYLCMFASRVNMNFTVYCCCLSEECTPHSIQYYDSLHFNCFLRGPCSPLLGWTALFPQMHHDDVRAEFLLEPVAKADFLRAATLMEHNTVTNVDADL